MSLLRKLNAWMFDGNGKPLHSYEETGALNVHVEEVHNIPIDEYFHRDVGSSTTIIAPSLAGATSIVVADATLLAGPNIEIRNGKRETTYPKVISVGVDLQTLNLDRPLDKAYEIGDEVIDVTFQMVDVGSVASPVSFKLQPPAGDEYHIVRILFSMTHSTAGDLGLFGNQNALQNGVVLRAFNGTTGEFRTYTVWKSNSDIKSDMYDVEFDTRSGGGGTYGTSGRGSLKVGSGAVPFLNGDNGDYLEMLIQDDLSGLLSFNMKAQGHFK